MKSASKLKDEDKRIELLNSLHILDSNAEEVYDDLVKLASTICGTPIGLVSLVDQDRQWFKAKVGIGASETPEIWRSVPTRSIKARSLKSRTLQKTRGFMTIPWLLMSLM